MVFDYIVEEFVEEMILISHNHEFPIFKKKKKKRNFL